jgi:hypothetical protein
LLIRPAVKIGSLQTGVANWKNEDFEPDISQRNGLKPAAADRACSQFGPILTQLVIGSAQKCAVVPFKRHQERRDFSLKIKVGRPPQKLAPRRPATFGTESKQFAGWESQVGGVAF